MNQQVTTFRYIYYVNALQLLLGLFSIFFIVSLLHYDHSAALDIVSFNDFTLNK